MRRIFRVTVEARRLWEDAFKRKKDNLSTQLNYSWNVRVDKISDTPIHKGTSQLPFLWLLLEPSCTKMEERTQWESLGDRSKRNEIIYPAQESDSCALNTWVTPSNSKPAKWRCSNTPQTKMWQEKMLDDSNNKQASLCIFLKNVYSSLMLL